MNILIINKTTDTPESNLYKGLVKAGHTVDLIVDPEDRFIEEMRELGLSVETHSIRHRFDFKAIRFIYNKLSSKKYDVVYAPTSRGITALNIAARKFSTAYVTYRGTMGHLSRFNPVDRLSHLNSRVNAIVCNCGAVKSYMSQLGIDPKKLHVVYKGHNPEDYISKSYTLSRDNFGVSKEDFLVACIANIRPVKGVEYLLKAMALPECKEMKLVVVGETNGSAIIDLAKDLGVSKRVQFLGFRRDAQEILSLCDVSVMPSVDREGVPRAIIESILQLVPSLVTNVGGLPEIIKDMDRGLVVDPRNERQIAENLVWLRNNQDKASQFAKNADSFVRTELAVDSYVKKMLGVFDSAISNLS